VHRRRISLISTCRFRTTLPAIKGRTGTVLWATFERGRSSNSQNDEERCLIALFRVIQTIARTRKHGGGDLLHLAQQCTKTNKK